MVQDLLHFLRPPSPRTRGSSERRQKTIKDESTLSARQAVPKASSSPFCIPLSSPRKKKGHVRTTSSMSCPSHASLLPDPVPDSRNRLLQSSRDDTATRDAHVQGDEGEESVVERLRTRDSEVIHIAHLRRAAEERARGHWLKKRRASLTARERCVFDRMRRESGGPVLASNVRQSLETVLDAVDPRHRPMYLRLRQDGPCELWEVDPFTDEIHVVEWVFEGEDEVVETKRKGMRPWSTFSRGDRPVSPMSSSSSKRQTKEARHGIEEISTIRLVT